MWKRSIEIDLGPFAQGLERHLLLWKTIYNTVRKALLFLYKRDFIFHSTFHALVFVRRQLAILVRCSTNPLTKLLTEPRHGEGVTKLSIFADQAGHFMPNNASQIPTKPDEDLLWSWQHLSIPRRHMNAHFNSSVDQVLEDSTSSVNTKFYLTFTCQKHWR